MDIWFGAAPKTTVRMTRDSSKLQLQPRRGKTLHCDWMKLDPRLVSETNSNKNRVHFNNNEACFIKMLNVFFSTFGFFFFFNNNVPD